jgi:hypothetical protein
VHFVEVWCAHFHEGLVQLVDLSRRLHERRAGYELCVHDLFHDVSLGMSPELFVPFTER